MCGRIAMTLPPDAMRQLFDLGDADVPADPPRYNICPTQPILVAVTMKGVRKLVRMRWGFLPHWYKTPTDGPLLNNARAETISDKPAFREAVRARRCLVPAMGFYEWSKATDKGRDPWFIQGAEGAPLVMAGIWQDWHGAEGTHLASVAIVTCAANGAMTPIHDRMPVLLAPEDFAMWLGEEGKGAALLMHPAPEDMLVAHRVSRAVNRSSANGPELIAPFTEA